jgi:hypothetical protein
MSRSTAALRRQDPLAVARELAPDPDDPWARELLRALEDRVRLAPLERLLSTWDLSAAGAARVFGVTRQAVAKWRGSGVPEDRLVALGDLAAATDVLERYVRRDRIPAVVRRSSDLLGGRSLLELAEQGRHAEVRRAVSEMLDLRRIAP